jgi:hypothetical protein
VNFLYGGEAADPYYATFGGNAIKEASAAWSWESRVGDYVTADQLLSLALKGRPLIEKVFGANFADEFSKKPIAIFESLPEPQKSLLARLAAQEPSN